MATPSKKREEAADGRTRRSERSRDAIVEAMLELVGSGTVRPTAQQVADEAGVGIRTVFRHFSDMETLYASMNARMRRRVGQTYGELARNIPDGSPSERARRLIEIRAEFFEQLRPYRLADSAFRWSSPTLQDNNARFVREMRQELRRWLPELVDCDSAVADAAEAALSLDHWEQLRGNQRLSARRARGCVELALECLLQSAKKTR